MGRLLYVYKEKCFFREESCPLKGKSIDGNLCIACASLKVEERQSEMLFAQRRGLIAGLITTYGDEEKAKEVYEKVSKFAKEWEVKEEC